MLTLALFGALLSAAEDLPDACRRHDAGEAEFGHIRSALDGVGRLLELFAVFEQPAGGTVLRPLG